MSGCRTAAESTAGGGRRDFGILRNLHQRGPGRARSEVLSPPCHSATPFIPANVHSLKRVDQYCVCPQSPLLGSPASLCCPIPRGTPTTFREESRCATLGWLRVNTFPRKMSPVLRVLVKLPSFFNPPSVRSLHGSSGKAASLACLNFLLHKMGLGICIS